MPRSATSYTELTPPVVREAPEPLPFAAIVEGVEALAPITTNNPKQTIRNAITSSHMLLATGNGRYGWKPRLLTGALLRLPLEAATLAGGLLTYSDEVRDALYPAFFGPQAYNDRSPVAVALPDGTATHLTLSHAGGSVWGSHTSPELKNWLDRSAAQAGDDLLLEVLNGETRHYRFALQRRMERDEAAIAGSQPGAGPMSGRPYDSRTEVGSPFSEAAHFTHRITIGSLKLAPGRRFLYLFDYGDDHQFAVEVRTRDEAAPAGGYPRVVGTLGRAPSQYGR